jgi:hypothetical protein
MRVQPRPSIQATRAGLLGLLLLAAPEAYGGVGYGYKKSEDPFVLGIKRIILNARTGAWPAARKEFTRLDWLFLELKTDVGADLAGDFEKALESQSLAGLSREISRVLYYAVAQKFLWNRKEECAKYVPAQSRVEAALFYYDEILSLGVRDHDRKTGSTLHKEIKEEFEILRRAIGTAGLFGILARPPDLKAFAASSDAVLQRLRQVYPHVGDAEGKAAKPPPAAEPRQPEAGDEKREP